MKLKNKLLLMFLLILLIFFNLNTVFASSTSFESTNNSGTVTFTKTNGIWSVVGKFCGTDISYTYNVQDTSDYYIIPFVTEKSIGTINYNYFKVPSNSNYFAKALNDNNSTDYFYFAFNCDKDYYFNTDLVSANTATNMYNRSTYPMCKVYAKDSDDVLFHCPVQGVVVPALGEAKELPKAIVETLKMIIPVGLVLLGIILLIYLIKRVIYLSH